MITREFAARIKRVGRTDVDVPVNVTLSYDWANDPFAVQAIFQVSQEEDRVWHFSRELLERGARALTPYGKGDVKFRHFPQRGAVLMCLRSGGHGPGEPTHADVALPEQEVAEFLNDTKEQADQEDSKFVGDQVDVFLKELFEA